MTRDARRIAAGLALAAGLLVAVGRAHAQDDNERAPFFTTPPAVVERMLAFAGTGPQDLVVDLGSGDGRIVIEAARRFGARAHGIELESSLVRLSRENARKAGVAERATFEENDVLRADFSRASVVTIYLLGSLMNRLQSRFLAELKPGTRIVSHAFGMTSWRPDRSITVPLPERHVGQGDTSLLHLWIVPAQVRGAWRSEPQGASPGWTLRIWQNYQMLDIEAEVQGKALAVTDPRLSGAAISWNTADARFDGRIDAGRIVGTLRRAAGDVPLNFVPAP